MQKMYVANCTRQVQSFMYRLPETNQPRQQTIPIGGQVQISGELSPSDVGAIVEQYSRYGMVSIEEAKKTRVAVPLVYSLDKTIPDPLIADLVRLNTSSLEDSGREQRKNAAIVMTNQLGRSMKEQGVEADLEEVDVEFVEDDDVNARNRRSATGDDRIRERTIVTRSDVTNKRNRGRNRGRSN